MIATPSLNPVFPTPQQVARDPVLFAAKFLKIQDKQMRTIPLLYKPAQLDYLNTRTRRDIILKSRQIGFTTAIQAEMFRYATTRAASIITLGKDDENTKEIRRIWKFYYDNLPANFRPRRLYDNATLTTFPDCGSRAVIGTAGSVDTGRGGTRTHAHLSEVAYYLDAQSIISGALQSGDLQWVALESTANGQQGKFYELCMDAYEGKGIWSLKFYPWHGETAYRTPLEPGETLTYTNEEGVLVETLHLTPEQIKWRRGKIAEIGSIDNTEQEYPSTVHSAFKHSGVGYFGDIDFCYIAPMFPEYDETHRYLAGVDFGQQDYTVCVVVDKTTMQMVDSVRLHQQSWADMRAAILKLCAKWHVKGVMCEENAMGVTNIEQLILERRNHAYSGYIGSFNMNAASKPPLMATLRTAIHEGGLKLQPIDALKHEMNGAVSKQTQRGWTVESKRDKDGGHGDYVIALALAIYMCGRL